MMNMNGASPTVPTSPGLQQPALPPMPAPPPPQPVDPQQLFQAQETLKKPTWDDIIARLRDDKLRSFTIDIETDSTIVADEETQKATVSEYFSNVGQFLTAIMPLVQQSPEFGPFAVEMLKYGARRFEAGRQMETVIEEMGDALLKRLANPPPTPPDPKMVAAQAQAQAAVMKGQAQIQVEQAKAQADSNLEQQKAQADMGLREAQAAADAQLQQSKADNHLALKAMTELSKPVHPIA